MVYTIFLKLNIVDNLILNNKSLNLNFLLKNFLYREIELIFFKKFNKFFIQEQFLVIRLFFVNFFFLKILISKFKNINFLFLNFEKFFSFFKIFFNIYSNIYNLYFFRLKLRGLGFILKRYSKYLFSFLMAVNHFYYFFIPKIFLIKKKRKYLICLSLDLAKLNILF